MFISPTVLLISSSRVNFLYRMSSWHGPLARYVKFRVAHAPGMPGTFSPPLRVSDPDMHHGTCVTHVPLCMPGSLTSDFLWYWWRGKRSRHSRRMRKPQFDVSGKRPMGTLSALLLLCGGNLLSPLWHFGMVATTNGWTYSDLMLHGAYKGYEYIVFHLYQGLSLIFNTSVIQVSNIAHDQTHHMT